MPLTVVGPGTQSGSIATGRRAPCLTRCSTSTAGTAGFVMLGDPNGTPHASLHAAAVRGPPGVAVDTGGFDHPDQGDAWRVVVVGGMLSTPSRVAEAAGCVWQGAFLPAVSDSADSQSAGSP